MGIHIGTDIEENQRFVALLQKPSFCQGFFTPVELAYLASKPAHRAHLTAAGIFCAKEAVAKALGVGFFGLRPQEIEIDHMEGGAPRATLLGGAAQRFPGVVLSVSISHGGAYTTATALAQGLLA